MSDPIRWAIEWYSCNRIDGETRRIMWKDSLPQLFHTRDQARAAIKEQYGYLAHRKDLRDEPHGWRMPRAVKVQVHLEKKASERSS